MDIETTMRELRDNQTDLMLITNMMDREMRLDKTIRSKLKNYKGIEDYLSDARERLTEIEELLDDLEGLYV